ncbi:hypothetical protein H5410_041361 [Solanum commersonii]|uniref:Uncharacterized protein n=1 Tax=Solanum commersonii TaxID=4109 RepID=A0A9J5XTE5_SOLCO|nr:hypothetical protein H5410_041361 [Solanum commersonii]
MGRVHVEQILQEALYYTEGDLAQEEELEVKDFIINGVWDEPKLRSILSEDMAEHIVLNIRPKTSEVDIDKAWLSGNTTGLFTVKSTYHLVRGRKAEEDWRSYNIEATGFHNYTICKEDAIYFWNKKAAQELFLSYNSQQKVIQRPTKVESLGAISESKACIQQRNRDEEAREPTGLLLFVLNWKTQGVRCIKKDGKDKEFGQYLHRSTKLK